MDLNFLNTILNTHSVSGFENEMREEFLNYTKEFVDSTYIDRMGNAYASIVSGNDSMKYMIEAHMDEIGFQVVYIDDNGYIYIRANGGVDAHCVPGSQVSVITSSGERVNGIIGKTPIHLLNSEERNKCAKISSLWIDTGLCKEQVVKKVSVGNPVAIMPNVLYLSENMISSKSLDNKIGVFIVSQVLKRLSGVSQKSFDVYGVATVQEEVGHRGAYVCECKVCPDLTISLDMDFATDVPNCLKSKYGEIALGRGVVIHRSIDNDIPMTYALEKLAKGLNIRHQISARNMPVGGTNAFILQQSQGGNKTISLGIPCRYMHTPVELCDLKDVNSAVDLLYNIITSPELIECNA